MHSTINEAKTITERGTMVMMFINKIYNSIKNGTELGWISPEMRHHVCIVHQLYWSQNYNIIKRRKGPIGIARTGK